MTGCKSFWQSETSRCTYPILPRHPSIIGWQGGSRLRSAQHGGKIIGKNKVESTPKEISLGFCVAYATMEADGETTEIKTETTLENQDLSFLQQTGNVNSHRKNNIKKCG